MAFETKSIRLPNGVRLEYVEQGDRSGMPLLLLHGVTDSWFSYQPILPHLPPTVHAIAITQRGHGDADRPATGYRTADFADDVALFTEALSIGPTIVVGHSMGSANAMRFAIDYPQRTLGLVLTSAFATFKDNPVILEFWDSAVSQLADPISPKFAREFQESTLAQPVPAEFLDTAVSESLKLPARVWRDSFEGMLEDDFTNWLKIRAPALILWGAMDSMCPRSHQDRLLAEIPGSRLIVYENAGHALHWEVPRRFAGDVVAFAESVARGG